MHEILEVIGARKRLAITLIAALAATLFAIQIAGSASAATKHHTKHHAHTSGGGGSATGLGQLSGLLPNRQANSEDRDRHPPKQGACPPADLPRNRASTRQPQPDREGVVHP